MRSDLSAADRRRLKARAHTLAPVAQVGRQGLSEPFLAEVGRALSSHELIKVRLRGERDERAALLDDLTERLACAVVGTVGSIAILYRESEEAGEAPRTAGKETQ